jgi:sec-independent protein translocase protein TatA
MSVLMIANLGATELALIVLVLLLLFGARKLPELARGTGQALRIFKVETRGVLAEEAAGLETDELPQHGGGVEAGMSERRPSK